MENHALLTLSDNEIEIERDIVAKAQPILNSQSINRVKNEGKGESENSQETSESESEE
ncbi:MAG: hypothetical protein IPK10_17520 [Bacteroidetes bacterium]|nr:hypothetical protein [Bacteroidota bacterium]